MYKRILPFLPIILIMLTGCSVGASIPVEERGAIAYQEAQEALRTHELAKDRVQAKYDYLSIATNYVFPEGDHFKVLRVYPVLFSNEVQLISDPHGILEQFDLEEQKLELYGNSGVPAVWRLCAAWDTNLTTQVVLTPEECSAKPKEAVATP